MSQLLPYVGAASLLLLISALWARQLFLARKGKIEVIVPRRHEVAGGRTASHGNLSERIFGLGDWDFVSRNMPSELQKMFLRERAVLAISWLRRTRRRVSLVMRAHVVAVQKAGDLQLVTELKLALSYLLFLILCDVLIAWIWVHGPLSTRKMVGGTLRTVVWLRGAFGQLMARIDPANYKILAADFSQGVIRD